MGRFLLIFGLALVAFGGLQLVGWLGKPKVFVNTRRFDLTSAGVFAAVGSVMALVGLVIVAV